MVFNNIRATQSTDRRASLYDEIEDDETIVTAAAPAAETDTARKAFWGTPRSPMTLAISEDEGKTWPTIRDIEVGDGYCMTNNSKEKLNREYSYPSIKQGSDNMLHITYTYFRQYIKYVRVSEEWARG